MPVHGADLVAKNITAFGKGFTKHVNGVMGRVSEGLEARVRLNSSLADHSLRELRRLGHPYAAQGGRAAIHDPKWLVHNQGGLLSAAIFKQVEEARIEAGVLTASAIVGVDEAKAPYAGYVVFGTSKMVPRDFLGESLEQFRPEADRFLKDNLRDLSFYVGARGTSRGG